MIVIPDLDLDAEGGWIHFIAPTIAGNEGQVVQAPATDDEASPRHLTDRFLEAGELGVDVVGRETVVADGPQIGADVLLDVGGVALDGRLGLAQPTSSPVSCRT
jgi:hypothetical protein